MSFITQVSAAPLVPSRLEGVLAPEGWMEFEQAITRAKELLKGRTVWHINSTAQGGGVAEMLRSFIAYSGGAGIDTRWAIISGEGSFFAITKRIHNLLHGASGDGGPLGVVEREAYEAVMERNLQELRELVRAKDIVCLHDPQTAGLVRGLKEIGAHVTWRSHVGTEHPNHNVKRVWRFLAPYLEGADAYIFTRPSYIPRQLKGKRTVIIPPSIDVFSPKNQIMDPSTAHAILCHIGLPVGRAPYGASLRFERQDGTLDEVRRKATIVGEPFRSTLSVPLVTQISRWDMLKDHLGVMLSFIEECLKNTDAHLILAGPSAEGVSDDPEGFLVFDRLVADWRDLPEGKRKRIHIVSLPMTDIDENAAIVNALQRCSTVIVQKSLQEGFGLTVSEAMWKARPVVASAVGGIQDQIDNDVSGILLPDPYDFNACGRAIRSLLLDEEMAHAMGEAARERVRHLFLDSAQWVRYISLFESLIAS